MKKLRFLLSLTTRDNDYQLEQAAAAQEAARGLDVHLEILYAENDAITQSTQILKALQGAPELRPGAIVFEPVGGNSLSQVARTAVGAGISWAVLNREVALADAHSVVMKCKPVKPGLGFTSIVSLFCKDEFSIPMASARVLVQPEMERGCFPLVSIPPLQDHCTSTTSIGLNFRMRTREQSPR